MLIFSQSRSEVTLIYEYDRCLGVLYLSLIVLKQKCVLTKHELNRDLTFDLVYILLVHSGFGVFSVYRSDSANMQEMKKTKVTRKFATI